MDNANTGDPRLGPGGNFPPEPTPLEHHTEKIQGLHDEAMLWLDGEVVDTPDMADGLSHLLNELRTAEKKANQARVAEKLPHLEAGRAVDDAYKPLLSKATKAIDTCKAALEPWLERVEAEYERMAEKSRAEAQAALAEAQEAVRAADRSNLSAVEEAEALLTRAKRIDGAATKAEKATASAGAHGRAVSLRTTHTPVISDASAALKHYRLTEPAALKDFLLSLAVRDVRAGKRSIPGIEIVTTKRAVQRIRGVE